MSIIGNDWDEILKDEFSKSYYVTLRAFLKNEYNTKIIYPKPNDVLKAFRLTPFNAVKVVILGQDPYHQEGQAEGFCFSVPTSVPAPSSLQNIFKELQNEFNVKRTCTSLTDWAEQGVLLLNTVLTVEQNKPASHQNKGWETFTTQVIKALNNKPQPIVFMLWGNHAGAKKELITNKNHLVLQTSHPSGLSCNRGFLGCNHFKTANKFLEKNGHPPINWLGK
ncbi:MAG: uracil-DNA glycosylase [Firmicutes bacterium]|nr:uracil-DNA glycosylase [Bacillota bacterium]